MKKTSTADRKAVAAHPELVALCAEFEGLGFSPFDIAYGLRLMANEFYKRGESLLTE